jgi:hypothetical protein
MPRGVYDRSKTKTQREAEKTKAPAKSAPKKTPKAAKAAPVAKTPKVSTAPKVHTSELDVGTKFAIIRENISTLSGAVQGLTSGQQTVIKHDVGPIVSLLDGELQANIEVLTSLRREVFGPSDAEKAADAEVVASAEEKDDDVEEETEAPRVAAPAQPYPAQPSGTVPMPPAPVGVPT